jgi:hypothetical protein
VAVLGILNNSCANQIPVAFTFQKATTDITNTVDMLQFGIGNELAVMAGDNPPFDGVQAVKPAPVVTQYPAFLNAIFDPDWVDYGADKIPGNGDDNNGPAPAIKPRFRAAAATYIGFAQLWVILQSVVFEPGTKLPQLPALDASYGYPAVTVLQTASAAGSATPPIAGAITDFCTPLKVNTALPGVTADNPDTPANEGGVPLRTLSVDGKADSPPAAAGTPIINIGYYISQRDADGDGIENAMDPCPLNADTVWNPRDQTQPIEGDGPDTTPAGPVSDGIPDTCDPTPEATGVQPSDHDDDGFPNRGDNCPLIANKTQDDKDKNADGEEVGDGIGDACDPNPGTPDGAEITCVKISAVEVGGAPEAAVSECLTSLPTPEQVQQIGEQLAETGSAGSAGATGTGASGSGAGGTGAGAGAGGVGGPSSGVGSLSPVAGTIPAWAAVVAALGVAGLIGSIGTLASRLVNRRRDD